MSIIRDKKLKKFHSDSRNTIDQIHNDIISQKHEAQNFIKNMAIIAGLLILSKEQRIY